MKTQVARHGFSQPSPVPCRCTFHFKYCACRVAALSSRLTKRCVLTALDSINRAYLIRPLDKWILSCRWWQTTWDIRQGGGGRGRKRREQSCKSVKAKWKQTCQAQDEVTGERTQGKGGGGPFSLAAAAPSKSPKKHANMCSFIQNCQREMNSAHFY